MSYILYLYYIILYIYILYKYYIYIYVCVCVTGFNMVTAHLPLVDSVKLLVGARSRCNRASLQMAGTYGRAPIWAGNLPEAFNYVGSPPKKIGICIGNPYSKRALNGHLNWTIIKPCVIPRWFQLNLNDLTRMSPQTKRLPQWESSPIIPNRLEVSGV